MKITTEDTDEEVSKEDYQLTPEERELLASLRYEEHTPVLLEDGFNFFLGDQ